MQSSSPHASIYQLLRSSVPIKYWIKFVAKGFAANHHVRQSLGISNLVIRTIANELLQPQSSFYTFSPSLPHILTFLTCEPTLINMLKQSLLTTLSTFLLGNPHLALGISSELQNILKNTHGSKAYGYPTDLTRDIFPVSFSLCSCLLK